MNPFSRTPLSSLTNASSATLGVARRVVEALRDQGHDTRHLREEELQRLPDDEIFRKAVAEIASS